MNCDALPKATGVNGIYSANPNAGPDARRYGHMCYDDVVKRNLSVMDLTAITLARNSQIPVIVFSVRSPGALMGAGKARAVSRSSVLEPVKTQGKRIWHSQLT